MHLSKDIDLLSASIGGLVLGFTSSAFLYFTGRITGMSGITGSAIITRVGVMKQKTWAVAYIGGLVTAGVILKDKLPLAFGGNRYSAAPFILCAAGTLTGFGTRLGNGCTSGHGICGLPRWSLRSLVAVMSFMASGAGMAWWSRSPHAAELLSHPIVQGSIHKRLNFSLIPTFVTAAYAMRGLLQRSSAEVTSAAQEVLSLHGILDHLTTFTSALIFGLGLGFSGMCNPEKVLGFLDFSGTAGWDPSLMGVMGGGVAFNALTFFAMHRYNPPMPLAKDDVQLNKIIQMGNAPANLAIDWKLVTGSMIFGMGWGLAGMCPGPGLVSVGASVDSAFIFVPSMCAGMVLQDVIFGPAAASTPHAGAGAKAKAK